MHFRRALPLLVVAVVIAACETGDERTPLMTRTPVASPTARDAHVIGLVGTMTGRESWRGEDAFEGADLAVQVLNRRSGRGERFELVTLDDRGRAARAAQLIERVAALDRVVGIVYAGPPEALPKTEEVLARARIPAVLCYGDLYGARLLEPHIFQTSPSLLWEARRIASYLLQDRRYEDIGLLASRSTMGDTAQTALTNALSTYGGAPPVVERYPGDANASPRWLSALAERRVDAIVVQASPDLTAGILEALATMDATYRTTRDARRGRPWHPQVVGFDLSISPRTRAETPGLVASDTYARGAHYLPIPSLESFRRAFVGWWGHKPLGWQQRAYDAAMMIGWAVDNRRGNADLARTLERLRGERFGGLDVTFGPDDHTAVGTTTVGLWVVPRPGLDVAERDRLAPTMPWVPLGRGFAIDRRRTDFLPEDWKYLFRDPPPPRGRAPRFVRARFGVTTTADDPVH